MKRFLFLVAILAAVSFAATASAQTQTYSGLWVGTATLKYVSEVNKQYSDLSFDLGLDGVKASDTLISKGADWKFNATSAYPGGGWMETGYDDSGWSSGPAPFTDSSQTTLYFRNSINVATPTDYSDLRIRLWRDDGVVVYLNGQEIFRNNLPTGSIGFNILALSEIGDNTLVEFTLPATLLQGGQNVLAAEVHQADQSTDLLFDLELTATLKEPANTELIAMDAAGWMYDDSGTDLGTSWRDSGYDDSGWSTGQGQFGYGENDEQTTVSDNTPTVYFRREFSGQGAGFTHLRILLLRDDGAVVYVNGTEVLRSNMPPGTIEYTTAPVKAVGSADEGQYLVVDVEISQVQGLVVNSGTDNVVAVEVHQHPAELGGSAGTTVGALTRTAAPLDLRLLFHVDGNNQVRMLKEVIQVYDSSKDAYVLLTDHTLVPNYTGVAIRDGVPVGRRLSAVGFDFQGPIPECTGGISPSGSIDCSIILDKDHPTNPFLHRYHPDHDNLDERYENAVVEAYEVTRAITLEFSSRYPADEDLPERAVPPAGWGSTLLGGYYTETLNGLHKDPITVHGPFILRKVADTATLTPAP